eukprot:c24723_g1_i6 orf=100-441(+)
MQNAEEQQQQPSVKSYSHDTQNRTQHTPLPTEELRLCNRLVMSNLSLTYACLLLYIVLSSGQIFFNKWVLSSKQFNFPYPVGLTLLHMVFSSILCFLVIRLFKRLLGLWHIIK